MSLAPKMAKTPGSVASMSNASPPPTHEEIAQLAYAYWVARGQRDGSAEEDWLRAEQDLMIERLAWGRHPAPHNS